MILQDLAKRYTRALSQLIGTSLVVPTNWNILRCFSIRVFLTMPMAKYEVWLAINQNFYTLEGFRRSSFATTFLSLFSSLQNLLASFVFLHINLWILDFFTRSASLGHTNLVCRRLHQLLFLSSQLFSFLSTANVSLYLILLLKASQNFVETTSGHFLLTEMTYNISTFINVFLKKFQQVSFKFAFLIPSQLIDENFLLCQYRNSY